MALIWLEIAIIGYFTWCLVCLFRNIRIAKQIGLPYIILPISEYNIPYFIATVSPLGRWLFFTFFPKNIGDYAKYSSAGWRWNAKYRIHEKHGDVLLSVSPGSVACNVADAEAITEILHSPARFPKPTWQYAILTLFGENVVTTEGTDWVRHRKHVNPPFNERNNSLVWQDSLRQACGMVSQWKSYATKGPEVNLKWSQNFRQLALHVISSAGFGVYLSFDEHADAEKEDEKTEEQKFWMGEKAPAGFKRTYRAALQFFSQNIVTILLVHQLFSETFLGKAPAFLRQFYEARKDVGDYLLTLLSNEKAKAKEAERNETDTKRRDNLLSILARQQNLENPPLLEISEKERDKPLTNEEIVGNVFIFSVAGHETTGSALSYAIIMLALHPEKERWLQDKLDEALKGQSDDPREWPYSLFGRLGAPLAVMFETLRMYPGVVLIPKWTSNSPQPLTVNGRTHIIPAGHGITLNLGGLHYNPKYWGPTVNEWDPSRWDPSNKSSFLYTLPQNLDVSNTTDQGVLPTLLKPVKGSWTPFSDGIRGCLGKKFAQVEFVAVLAVLFTKNSVKLVLEEGETEEDARKRVMDIVELSSFQNNLSVRKPFGIKLVPREKKEKEV